MTLKTLIEGAGGAGPRGHLTDNINIEVLECLSGPWQACVSKGAGDATLNSEKEGGKEPEKGVSHAFCGPWEESAAEHLKVLTKEVLKFLVAPCHTLMKRAARVRQRLRLQRCFRVGWWEEQSGTASAEE